uniref:Crossover junction endonuclease EME1 n=1 Tax=Geotrypetes seraphini TaxID=260995 RepID=A0A6P8ST54_GEOSA|nr:crossover junction endonuclease EME1 [Geotrypetes seraphini]XP_033817883.1 crossover junction endonuclease EME1 [Geotrypetes seraphini]XP_033817884.1 crossover junction endonuclease EME1 [Geotrypetes seraphini]XP_033817885.1 crossover junction endonuclease EME1 [Geotrypetes seraphini]XP_033817886.1 crossover junction endonuclease EME1 [Geotrypetes seraphini]XP_033817888.1 crossover junction endonuclease EME1 [Geotrypetes seraphini]
MKSTLPSSSDSEDEELPKFTFLQHLSRRTCPLIVLESSDSETSCCSSGGASQEQPRAIPCEKRLAMISSEEEEQIVCLTERLKGRFMTSSSDTKLSVSQQPSSKASVSSDGSVGLGTDSYLSMQAQQVWQATAFPSGETLDYDGVTGVSMSKPLHEPLVGQLEHPGSTGDAHEVEADPTVPPPQKKVKQNQGMERAQQEALWKKRAQEGLQTNNRKSFQEQEKARRAVLARAVKAQRPEECLKHIQVLIDPALLQLEGGGQLLSALQAMQSSCKIEKQTLPYSICWRRRVLASQVEEDSWLEEPNVVVLVPREEFVSMIHSSKQVCSEVAGAQRNLRSFVEHILAKSTGKTISLAVVQMEQHFRTQNHQSQKKLRNTGLNGNAQEKQKRRKRKEGALPVSSRVDIEEALVDLQLHTGMQVRFLETWKEFADFTSMFTKAVAEAPFKHEREKTGFSFYLEGDWSGGVKVDRCGKGLLQVWKRQIQQLNRVSMEIANAVVSNYPSPQLLVQAYHRCLSEHERQNLLADILVRRGEGVISTSRRVGPELSKRIYLQLTSDISDLLLEISP